MKRLITWEMTLVALLVAWAVPGCLSPTSPTSSNDLVTRTETVNLDDPYGGYNLGDEPAAFSDPTMVSEFGPQTMAAFDDPTLGDSAVVRAMNRRAVRRYLMITWGNLRADSTIDFVTDWSGSLTVDNGALVLHRTIRFDARDQILPRTSRDKIEWVSFTKPSFDGILVAIHKILAPDSTADTLAVAPPETAPLTVTFATGPLTVTLSEDELTDLHRVVKVDEAGNAVAFNTITVMPSDCPAGFLAGQWHSVDRRPGGAFRGKWISLNGVHMGYVRGVYGTNSSGEKVFFGKWITASGRFQGLLRGRYDVAVDRPGGRFQGVWMGRDLRVLGGLAGEYRADADGHGFFRGVWRKRCR